MPGLTQKRFCSIQQNYPFLKIAGKLNKMNEISFFSKTTAIYIDKTA